MTTLPQFAAAVLISLAGLPVGFFLASVTKEEMNTAKKYFPMLQRIIIIAAAAGIMAALNFSWQQKLASYLFIMIALLFRINLSATYLIFGVGLALAAYKAHALLMISTLVFLFGMMTGSDNYSGRISMEKIMKCFFTPSLAYSMPALAVFYLR